VKEAGITVAALGGVLTSVIGIVNFFYARHIRLDAKHIKQLAARNAQVSHNGQKAIGQKVDDVKSDLAKNTAKTEEVSKKTDVVVKQTNGAMEKAVREVVSEKLDEKFKAFIDKRDKDLPAIIKAAVQEALKSSVASSVMPPKK
jgi:hypothetical protein